MLRVCLDEKENVVVTKEEKIIKIRAIYEGRKQKQEAKDKKVTDLKKRVKALEDKAG